MHAQYLYNKIAGKNVVLKRTTLFKQAHFNLMI